MTKNVDFLSQLNNLILKCCEIYEPTRSRPSLSWTFWMSWSYCTSSLLQPALITLQCVRRSSAAAAQRSHWWEQRPVSSSWTHVGEAALWENSLTVDYAWRQVTCQVSRNEAEIKPPFASQVRPLFKLDSSFFFSPCALWCECEMRKRQTDWYSGQMFWHIWWKMFKCSDEIQAE